MLKWEDVQSNEATSFGSLTTGTPFECDDFLYIKTGYEVAFDVINYGTKRFDLSAQVIEREATITFH